MHLLRCHRRLSIANIAIRSGEPRDRANIAEGFGHFRPTEFARFLAIARASLMETHNHLGDARDLGYVTRSEHDEMISLTERALGASTRLLIYLRGCSPKNNRPTTLRHAKS